MASSGSNGAVAVEQIDYVEGAGPGIPELEQPIERALPAEQAPAIETLGPGWEEKTVEDFLNGTGHGLHLLLGAGEKDWLMTRTDLDRIAPPLTRILNRYEPAVRASAYADPLLVAGGFGLYGWRSALQRQAAIRAKAEGRGDGYVDTSQLVAEEPAAAGEGGEEIPDYIPYADRRPE